TVERWRRWWLKIFTKTSFWHIARAAFMPPVNEDELPVALLERFAGKVAERMSALLRFLRPIPGGQVQAVELISQFRRRRGSTPSGHSLRVAALAEREHEPRWMRYPTDAFTGGGRNFASPLSAIYWPRRRPRVSSPARSRCSPRALGATPSRANPSASA